MLVEPAGSELVNPADYERVVPAGYELVESAGIQDLGVVANQVADPLVMSEKGSKWLKQMIQLVWTR